MLEYFGHGKTKVRQSSPWKFAYIGGTVGEKRLETPATLKGLSIGDRARVSGYEGNEDIEDFRRSGLSVGAEIRILSRQPSGSVIVQQGENQIGLGAMMVDRIRVQPL